MFCVPKCPSCGALLICVVKVRGLETRLKCVKCGLLWEKKGSMLRKYDRMRGKSKCR